MKKTNSTFLSVILLMTALGCSDMHTKNRNIEKDIPKKEHAELSVLWQQNAAEYKALSHQAFNIATKKILNFEPVNEKPLAIITDIDETVLDNSPYSGMQIKNDLDYDKNDWIEWGKLKKAKGLPGAVKFFNLADSLGIEVFYISNRYQVQLAETIENLELLNLPNADSNHVFLRTNTSEKQERRDRVLNDFNIIFYMGDNLSDFSSVFDNQNAASRNESVDKMSEEFGTKFIVFPNPMYGDWESKGLYNGNRNWSVQKKDSIRNSKITSYK
ncbi:5'-nucleotidase, lipoprotein e(P4) family [Flavobacteriaceae bacterium]|nr:5'-nucleotidase, lipoprotein e(P4) family [Flavobacteriaceae bacterium]